MCWVALLTPGPDQDEAAETIRGIQVLRGDPGRGWVELDPPDVIGLDDVVQFRARNALPVDPHRRLAAPGADRESGNSPEQVARAPGRDPADVRELEKPAE